MSVIESKPFKLRVVRFCSSASAEISVKFCPTPNPNNSLPFKLRVERLVSSASAEISVNLWA